LSVVSDHPTRYGIDELATLGGVSRRTVRYYVQEQLLPPPLGVGRGRHYDRAHLDRLLQVKAQQEAGRSLDEIRGRTARPAGRRQMASSIAPAVAHVVPRSAWSRLDLAPGVELHISSDVRMPSESRLEELAAWCLRHLPRHNEGEE
jgi:DNA-binding transcriptional MerR regulator